MLHSRPLLVINVVACLVLSVTYVTLYLALILVLVPVVVVTESGFVFGGVLDLTF